MFTHKPKYANTLKFPPPLGFRLPLLYAMLITQPGHPFVGRRNEYQPKGGDALRLGSKGRHGSCVGGM